MIAPFFIIFVFLFFDMNLTIKFCLFLSTLSIAFSCNSKTSNMKANQGNYEHTNELIHESSPYLLQHAHNPVNWHPWGEKALKKAKDENKLLIISVGYAACHWCHVMEEESFEDSLVAAIMNEHFVPIKVDREERPDVDDIYMTACQLISGRGGWPLNAFALSDGSPIWAGTYFPKEDWLKVLNQFVDLKKTNYSKLEDSAKQLTQGIKSQDEIIKTSEKAIFKQSNLDQFSKNIYKISDNKYGGRSGSPKFPMPSIYEYLLKQYRITNDKTAIETINKTLISMAEGGIYDQLGGGFARYSTDEMWFAPHFEKMLYDNGQLVSLYSKAYQATKNPLFKEVVEASLDFVNAELTDESGTFYSSLDADSEGEEGKFYVWNAEELQSILGAEDYPIFKEYYNITDKGNWEKSNILYRTIPIANIAIKNKKEKDEIETIIERSKRKLLEIRSKRIKPALDDKVITAWNGLMISGYIDAYNAFNHDSYKASALKAADFIATHQMSTSGQLQRNFKNGKSSINAFLDDYAFMILAYIDAYEISFDEKYLNYASQLMEHCMAHFYDEKTGMFYYTSDLDPPLVARKMELNDNVIPGSNSSIARALFKLGTVMYNAEYTNRATQMLNNMHENLITSDRSDFSSSWISLYNEIVNNPYEIAIVGPDSEKLRNEMMRYFLPDAIFLGGIDEGKLKLLEGKLQEGETFIYVCQNKVCKFPVRDVESAIDLMTR